MFLQEIFDFVHKFYYNVIWRAIVFKLSIFYDIVQESWYKVQESW